ncbi:protein XRP2-like [Ciona intestinalis]
MGCFGSKEKEDPEKKTEEKQYSWDKREKIDPALYTVEDLNDELVIRDPGSIDGQQFIIQNCKNTRIYLFDHIASITVDDCVDCCIIVGPVMGSIFIRDCENCKFIVACQQFRTRDCSKLDVFLSCATQPIIEASAKLKFGCYQLNYDGLKEQFEKSQLSLFCNNWCNVHDFTPVTEKSNWSLISKECSVNEIFPGLEDNGDGDKDSSTSKLNISTNRSESVVLVSLGSRPKPSLDSCFVAVFPSNDSYQVARNIVTSLKDKCVLVQIREINLTVGDMKRIFPNSDLSVHHGVISSGSVIGIELNGDNCCDVCTDVISNIPPQQQRSIYSSSNKDEVSGETERFFDFCDIQMNN